jgi:hypothetical protein
MRASDGSIAGGCHFSIRLATADPSQLVSVQMNDKARLNFGLRNLRHGVS